MECRGNLHPISSELATALGFDFTTTFMFSTRQWPGGNMARAVVITGPDVGELEQVGEPKRFRMSASTAHDEVYLRAVGTSWQR